MQVRKIYWFGGYGVGGRVFMEIEFDIPVQTLIQNQEKVLKSTSLRGPSLTQTQSTITLVNTSG